LKSNFDQSREGMRSMQRSKRRKTNIILNGLIGLVILLIIIVSVNIFSGNNDNQEKKQEQKVEKKVSSSNSENDAKTASGTTKQKQTKNTQKTTDDNAKEDTSKVVTTGGGENVKSTIENPAWEPVGTSQTEPFSSEAVDWDERVKALAYATDMETSNMTVWYLTRNGSDQSIGTVTAKGDSQAYRVYLVWKDGKGWMPTKVEELIENDKGKTSASDN
jgi:cytoskeletal protein RodZ